MALLRPMADGARGARDVDMLQDERDEGFVRRLPSARLGPVGPPQLVSVVHRQLQHTPNTHPHLLVELPARGGLRCQYGELCGEKHWVVFLEQLLLVWIHHELSVDDHDDEL